MVLHQSLTEDLVMALGGALFAGAFWVTIRALGWPPQRREDERVLYDRRRAALAQELRLMHLKGGPLWRPDHARVVMAEQRLRRLLSRGTPTVRGAPLPTAPFPMGVSRRGRG